MRKNNTSHPIAMSIEAFNALASFHIPDPYRWFGNSYSDMLTSIKIMIVICHYCDILKSTEKKTS